MCLKTYSLIYNWNPTLHGYNLRLSAIPTASQSRTSLNCNWTAVMVQLRYNCRNFGQHLQQPQEGLWRRAPSGSAKTTIYGRFGGPKSPNMGRFWPILRALVRRVRANFRHGLSAGSRVASGTGYVMGTRGYNPML